MSQILSDNKEHQHPKPAQEFERNPEDNYNDWDDEAAVIAAVDIAYRPNKYFWIAGVLKQCDNDGTTFRSVSGGGSAITTIWVMATAGLVTNVEDLIGKSVKLLLRGGIGSGEILMEGPAATNKIFFDTATGDLNVAEGNEFRDDEELTIQFI